MWSAGLTWNPCHFPVQLYSRCTVQCAHAYAFACMQISWFSRHARSAWDWSLSHGSDALGLIVRYLGSWCVTLRAVPWCLGIEALSEYRVKRSKFRAMRKRGIALAFNAIILPICRDRTPGVLNRPYLCLASGGKSLSWLSLSYLGEHIGHLIGVVRDINCILGTGLCLALLYTVKRGLKSTRLCIIVECDWYLLGKFLSRCVCNV